MKKKQSNWRYSKHTLTREEKADIAKGLAYNNRLVYKKIKRGYKAYCFMCDEYMTLTDEELKQVRASNMCPICRAKVKTGIKLHEDLWGYVTIPVGDDVYGYYAIGKWEFGKKPKITYAENVLVVDKEGSHRSNVVKGIGYRLYRTKTNGWRPCSWDYQSFFYSTYKPWDYGLYRNLSKKEYYEQLLTDIKGYIKSNQRKIIEDNLVNRNQVHYMIAFNLNSIEQILKYSAYMKKYHLSHFEVNQGLNEYYLKYLVKHKINLGDFLDYKRQCELLGVKLDKPKNFNEKHNEYSKAVKYKKNEKYRKAIEKLPNKLNQYAYNGAKYSIQPLGSIEEIIEVGDKLHNCIATYIEQYAKGITTLWRLDVGDKLYAALEVRSGLLIQARTDFNQECSTEHKRTINRWLKYNHWKIDTGHII